jgi:hypothetical protein
MPSIHGDLRHERRPSVHQVDSTSINRTGNSATAQAPTPHQAPPPRKAAKSPLGGAKENGLGCVFGGADDAVAGFSVALEAEVFFGMVKRL